MEGREPAIGVDDFGQGRTLGQDLMSYRGRLIATTAPLMRPLLVVVLPKCLSGRANFFQRGRTSDLDTLFFVGFVVSLYVTI
jgi:hypothetical protein